MVGSANVCLFPWKIAALTVTAFNRDDARSMVAISHQLFATFDLAR